MFSTDHSRRMLIGLLLALSCPLSAFPASTTASADAIQDSEDTIGVAKLSPPIWQDANFPFYDQNGTSELVGKKALFSFQGRRAVSKIPVTVIAQTSKHGPFCGNESDFYVDTGSEVVGIRMASGGRLQWSENLTPASFVGNLDDLIADYLTPASSARKNLDSLIAAFETHADLAQLFRVSTTDLPLEPGFFADPAHGSEPGPAKLRSAQVNHGGMLKLSLESPSGTSKAIVYVDLESREVVRAIEDKVVFPLNGAYRETYFPAPSDADSKKKVTIVEHASKSRPPSSKNWRPYRSWNTSASAGPPVHQPDVPKGGASPR